MKEKLAKGVLWLGGAKALVNVLSLCSTFILARLLTPEDFGIVAIASMLITLLSSVTEMSLSAALVHHESPSEQHFQSAWTLNFLRGVLLSIVLAASSPLVAHFYGETRLQPVLLALALSVFISGCINPKLVTLTRQLEFWQDFAVAVAQKLLAFVVAVGMAVAFKSYWALIGGTLAGQVAAVLVSYWVVRFRPRFNLSRVRELWSFSVWVTLGNIVNTLNWKLDHVLVSFFLSPRVLGVYTVGDNLAGLPTREAIAPLQQTLFPGLRKVVDSPTHLRRTYSRAQALISMLALPIGFGCSALAEPLVHVLLGAKWRDAILIVQVLACVFALQTLSSPVQPLALAKGQTRMMFVRDTYTFVMRVPIILVGMWLAGVNGVIFGRLISGLLSILINAALVRRLIDIPVWHQLCNSWRSLVSVAVMWTAVLALQMAWPINDWTIHRLGSLLMLAAAGAFIYMAIHLLLWLLSGKPEGAESDLWKLGRGALQRMKLRERAGTK